MNDKLLYLIAYAIVVCLITIRSFIKKEPLIYCALWAMTAVSAGFSIICKIDQGTFVGYGTSQNLWYDLSKTTWWGYALIILCNLIAFEPLRIFNRNNELLQFGSDDKSKRFFEEFSLIFLILSVVYFVTSIGIIKNILSISDYGALRLSLFNNSENEGAAIVSSNVISNVILKLCLRFKFISIFIGLAMIKEKHRVFLAAILMVDTFFLYYLYCAANAARGGLLIFFFIIGVIGLVFFPYLSKENKRRIFIGVMLVLGVVLSFFLAVTISRLATNSSGGNLLLKNISFYLGHAPIEFSRITGTLDHFAYGRTIFGRIVSHFLGTPYHWESIAVDIGYPPIGALFVTYLGFMYTDFGAVGCVAFVSLWSAFACHIIRKRPNKISTIFFFLYYLSFFVTGVFTVGRLEFVAVITTFVIYFVIRFVEATPILSRLFSVRIIGSHNSNRKKV